MTAETCWCVIPDSDQPVYRSRCGAPATGADGLCNVCRAECQQPAKNATGTQPETSAK